MVSVGHTYSKCQDLLKFEFSGGGVYSPKVKTQNLLSAKISLDLNFQWGRGGGGRGFSQSQNSKSSKCQDLPKFEFLPKSKIKVPSPGQIFTFGDGGGGVKWGTKSQNRVNWYFSTKFSITPASYCITDSLSYTMYVETKLARGGYSVLVLFKVSKAICKISKNSPWEVSILGGGGW